MPVIGTLDEANSQTGISQTWFYEMQDATFRISVYNTGFWVRYVNANGDFRLTIDASQATIFTFRLDPNAVRFYMSNYQSPPSLRLMFYSPGFTGSSPNGYAYVDRSTGGFILRGSTLPQTVAPAFKIARVNNTDSNFRIFSIDANWPNSELGMLNPADYSGQIVMNAACNLSYPTMCIPMDRKIDICASNRVLSNDDIYDCNRWFRDIESIDATRATALISRKCFDFGELTSGNPFCTSNVTARVGKFDTEMKTWCASDHTRIYSAVADMQNWGVNGGDVLANINTTDVTTRWNPTTGGTARLEFKFYKSRVTYFNYIQPGDGVHDAGLISIYSDSAYTKLVQMFSPVMRSGINIQKFTFTTPPIVSALYAQIVPAGSYQLWMISFIFYQDSSLLCSCTDAMPASVATQLAPVASMPDCWNAMCLASGYRPANAANSTGVCPPIEICQETVADWGAALRQKLSGNIRSLDCLASSLAQKAIADALVASAIATMQQNATVLNSQIVALQQKSIADGILYAQRVSDASVAATAAAQVKIDAATATINLQSATLANDKALLDASAAKLLNQQAAAAAAATLATNTYAAQLAAQKAADAALATTNLDKAYADAAAAAQVAKSLADSQASAAAAAQASAQAAFNKQVADIVAANTASQAQIAAVAAAAQAAAATSITDAQNALFAAQKQSADATAALQAQLAAQKTTSAQTIADIQAQSLAQIQAAQDYASKLLAEANTEAEHQVAAMAQAEIDGLTHDLNTVTAANLALQQLQTEAQRQVAAANTNLTTVQQQAAAQVAAALKHADEMVAAAKAAADAQIQQALAATDAKIQSTLAATDATVAANKAASDATVAANKAASDATVAANKAASDLAMRQALALADAKVAQTKADADLAMRQALAVSQASTAAASTAAAAAVADALNRADAAAQAAAQYKIVAAKQLSDAKAALDAANQAVINQAAESDAARTGAVTAERLRQEAIQAAAAAQYNILLAKQIADAQIALNSANKAASDHAAASDKAYADALSAEQIRQTALKNAAVTAANATATADALALAKKEFKDQTADSLIAAKAAASQAADAHTQQLATVKMTADMAKQAHADADMAAAEAAALQIESDNAAAAATAANMAAASDISNTDKSTAAIRADAAAAIAQARADYAKQSADMFAQASADADVSAAKSVQLSDETERIMINAQELLKTLHVDNKYLIPVIFVILIFLTILGVWAAGFLHSVSASTASTASSAEPAPVYAPVYTPVYIQQY